MLENRITEFKREYTDDIRYAVIAFANTDGGTIYIGINNDGSVRGVDDADGTLLRVTNMVRDVIRPDVTMFVSFDIEEIDEKSVVVLNVQRGTARPYYLAGKGVRPEGVYIRQGASSVPASETKILNMIKETSGDRYEDARSLNQQLSFEKATAYFEKKKIDFGKAQKRTMNIISEDGTYSNLGMLLSEQCTHTIKLAVFEGSKKSVFRDRKELNGSLLSQMEDAFAYIDQFNHTRAEFEGLERIDKRDYPTQALREALLNAIVHRDYSMSSSTLISIFDDRIEIVTIGGLVNGISYDDMMLGVSVLRNPHLANIFYRLRLIEAYGTGMLKINESYADYNVKPTIEVTENAFKMTLPNINYARGYELEQKQPIKPDKPRAAREEKVIGLFESKGTIERKDVEAVLGVSQATAVLVLRKMVDSGSLVKEGAGKSTIYRLANNYIHH